MTTEFRSRFTKRVRVHECDLQGVLYHGTYVTYCDIGIVEYWRSAGRYETMDPARDANFHIVRALVDYARPIVVDELIEIRVRCHRVGTSSITFAVELHGPGEDDLRARGEIVHVQVDGHRGGAMPVLPRNIALLEQFEGRPFGRG